MNSFNFFSLATLTFLYKRIAEKSTPGQLAWVRLWEVRFSFKECSQLHVTSAESIACEYLMQLMSGCITLCTWNSCQHSHGTQLLTLNISQTKMPAYSDDAVRHKAGSLMHHVGTYWMSFLFVVGSLSIPFYTTLEPMDVMTGLRLYFNQCSDGLLVCKPNNLKNRPAQCPSDSWVFGLRSDGWLANWDG